MRKPMIYSCLLTIILSWGGIFANGWRSGAALQTPRYGATSVVMDGFIYVIGGATANGQILNSVERYDSSTQTWDATAIAPTQIPRLDAVAMIVDGKIYLMGGYTADGEVTDAVEEYDLAGNSWSFSEDLRKKRRGHIAVSIWNAPCVVGGIGDSGEYEDKAEWLNPDDDKWEDIDANYDLLRFKPFSAAKGHAIYIFGGIFNYPTANSHVGEVSSDWEITWNALPDLPVARANGTTATVNDSIFMIGGVLSNNYATGRVDIFDFTTQQFTQAPDLPTARISMTSAVLDDEIYVIGGYANSINSPVGTVEIYSSPLTAIDPSESGFPESFALLHGYPNPFNGSVQLAVNIPQRADYQLTIFDINGRKVRTLHNGNLPSGERNFQWNAIDETGKNVSSGIYLAVLQSRSSIQKLKIVYVK
ncbi:MAG: T9SS type A sorting domain-containing protein [Calditrichaeota bacterium]|nr:T9SS type A sorting domain-containing protein [Calditrichota bacterium]